ncbi:cytoskeleton-associated protein 2-like [Agrilus planipennis]|uniref:Cytoskeleton-associated protein 2-like n=1 Tax=Agrilus planipennis TaxID=224129 RepID=A0A1W4WY68_AGRPL|nr:cytoskeleton-associated protein 2-like [Agrilus planipennis]XP_018325098.1 cytoskeleton-associated protein 2-like [Agrilus planipennis]
MMEEQISSVFSKQSTGAPSSCLKRNPSLKRRKNVPVIKQTKTSMIRMVNANPLLLTSDMQKENKKELTGIGIPKSFSLQSAKDFNSYSVNTFKKTSIPSSTASVKLMKKPTSPKCNTDTRKRCLLKTTTKFNQQADDLKKKPIEFVKPAKSTQLTKSNNKTIINKVPQNSAKYKLNYIKPNELKENLNGIPDNKRLPKRRSLSAEHYDRQNKKINTLQKTQRRRDSTKSDQQKVTTKRRSLSAENFDTKFLETPSKNVSHTKNNYISPIEEERSQINRCSKTPNSFNRVFFSTPMATLKTPATIKKDMYSRLNEWLKKRNRPLYTYHHLKCFGVKQSDIKEVDEENKENIEEVLVRSESYNDLRIDHCEKIPQNETNLLKNVDYKIVSRDALNDLYSLINDGYSEQQCIIWLNLIHEKCPEIEQYPKYWECRAALEQCKGNLTDAIECYKKAVVKGADVQDVDSALEDLLKKFSVLNISNSAKELEYNDKLKREKAFVLQQARNAFKSSVIQFAIKEKLNREQKENEQVKQIMVTPVRRSVRLSKSCHNTPGMRICSNLCQLEPEKMIFQNNPALSIRYN